MRPKTITRKPPAASALVDDFRLHRKTSYDILCMYVPAVCAQPLGIGRYCTVHICGSSLTVACGLISGDIFRWTVAMTDDQGWV